MSKNTIWKCDWSLCPRVVEGMDAIPEGWISRTGRTMARVPYEGADTKEWAPYHTELHFCSDACNQKQKKADAVAGLEMKAAYVAAYRREAR